MQVQPGTTTIKKCCRFNAGVDPDAVLIVGAANAGLVGTIAANHIIETLELEEVAHINSKLFPPISVFIDGVLKHPFRIYADVKDKPAKVFVATSELPLNRETYHDISHILIDYAEDIGIKTVVTLIGFPVQYVDPEVELDVFFAAEPEIFDRLKNIEKLQPIPRGMIYGIESLILNETLEREIDGYALIVPVQENLPGTRSAAAVIEILNKIYSYLDVDVQELLERDEMLQKKLRELAEQIQRQKLAEAGQYAPPPPSKSLNTLFT